MLFKEIKPGHVLYLLNKETMELKHGNVTNATAPHIESKPNSLTQLVVDITANIDGKPTTYVIPDNSVITYSGNTLITASKETLIGEIKATKSQCEQLLSSVESTKAKISKCDELISELDEAYKEKQVNEARLSKIERMMQSLLDKLGD